MKRLLVIMIALSFLIPGKVYAQDSSQMRVHFLAVGQADAILIQTPGGKNVLVDGGANYAADRITSYLKKHGVKRINMMIATHLHHDHIGAMDKLIHDFPVDALYIPPSTHTTHSFRDLQKAVDKQETTVLEAKTGQSIYPAANVRLDVMAPLRNHYRNENDHSLVLRLTHGKNRFLLMGDATKQSEQDLFHQGADLDADVLKVGHHGGRTTTSESFLAKVDPQVAVLSVGNNQGFPSEDVLDRLKRRNVTPLSTHQFGTIIAASDGEAIVFHMGINNMAQSRSK